MRSAKLNIYDWILTAACQGCRDYCVWGVTSRSCLLQSVMSATADSHNRRLLALVTLTVFCLMLGTYRWQSTKSCSFITTPLLSMPVPERLAENTLDTLGYTVTNCSFPRTQKGCGVSKYDCSFTSFQTHNCKVCLFWWQATKWPPKCFGCHGGGSPRLCSWKPYSWLPDRQIFQQLH